MMRSAAAAKIPPSRQDAVRSRKTFCGDRAVKLRLYGNSSRKRWMPAGVLRPCKIPNSEGGKTQFCNGDVDRAVVSSKGPKLIMKKPKKTPSYKFPTLRLR